MRTRDINWGRLNWGWVNWNWVNRGWIQSGRGLLNRLGLGKPRSTASLLEGANLALMAILMALLALVLIAAR